VGVPAITVGCPVTCLPLNFGTNSFLFGGAGVTKVVTVKNTGNTGLIMGIASIGAATTNSAPSDYTIVSNLCAAKTIAIGGSCTITVKFRNAALLGGTFKATLSIASNAATVKVPMTGAGSL